MLQILTELFSWTAYPNKGLKTEVSDHRNSSFFISDLRSLRQRLLGISPEEATFARRGFHGGDRIIQQRLEQIGRTFLQGYNAAIAKDNLETLVAQLNAVEAEWRGFAFEGAAMGLALLDYLTPWKRNRVQNFLAGAGADHAYMVHVGVGWLLARIPFGVEQYLKTYQTQSKIGILRQEPEIGVPRHEPGNETIGILRQEPEIGVPRHEPGNETYPKSIERLLGWLAIDGYGFHQGYFHWLRYVEGQVMPSRLSDYAQRVFDQGLGRSLWFVDGADVARIQKTLRGFHPRRRADLWSGIGLACAYAGGVDRAAIEALRTGAGSYLPQLAQGAAFAAKARSRAGNPALHTEIACQVLCGMSALAAAEITDIALKDLPMDGALPAYEIWRQRIQNQFAAGGLTA